MTYRSTDSAREGFETGHFGPYPWTHAGASLWKVTSDESNFGSYSAQAGRIADDESTSLTMTRDCGDGQIRFWRKVSCERNWDFFEFYIDSQLEGQWTVELDWEEVSYPVDAGSHTVLWTYTKDSSVSEGQDTAWIDDIVFPIAD